MATRSRTRAFTAARVGSWSGVCQPVISAYECGRREPGLSMLAKVVEATGCDLSIKVTPGVTSAGAAPIEPHFAVSFDVTARRSWGLLLVGVLARCACSEGWHAGTTVSPATWTFSWTSMTA